MAECTKCLDSKPDTEFSKRTDTGGLRSWCKKCVSIKSKKFYSDNRDKVLARQKQYAKDPIIKARKREYARNWARKNPRTPEAEKRRQEIGKKRYHSNPEVRKKASCRGKTKRLIEKGVIKRLDYCEYPKCKHDQRIEIHHWDYNDPYNIAFLCTIHHALADKIRILIVNSLPNGSKCNTKGKKR